MKRHLVMLLALSAAAVGKPALAQANLSTTGAPLVSALNASALTRRLIADQTFQRADGSAKTPGSPITFPDRAGPSPMPSILAEAFPVGKRAEAKKTFESLLALYPKVEQRYQLPHNDLAGAVAVFLAGCYQAYRGPVEDDQFVALAAQLRGILAKNPAVVGASDEAKQEMHDQMVTLGLFFLGVEEALKGQPNPEMTANMKRAGGEYLAALLGTDPSLIEITSAGLMLPAVHAARERTDSTLATSPARPPRSGTTDSDAARLSDGIETVGFYGKTGIGYGGMILSRPTPIVLFRSGEALYEMEALKFEGGLAAHKAANPDDWTKWRRSNGAIEVVGKKGWERIAYTKTMDRLPAGFRLAGQYQRLSGGGDLAVGGTSAVAVWSTLSLDNAGNFVSGGGSSAQASTEGAGSRATVVTAGRAPDQYGRYSIEGYTLTLQYANGRVERRMIVTDRTEPGVIWLDGDGYTSNKN